MSGVGTSGESGARPGDRLPSWLDKGIMRGPRGALGCPGESDVGNRFLPVGIKIPGSRLGCAPGGHGDSWFTLLCRLVRVAREAAEDEGMGLLGEWAPGRGVSGAEAPL